MRIRKILLILIIVLGLSGCVNLNNLDYEDIINDLSNKPKPANIYKRGYQFYIPKGLQLSNAGSNYAIISSDRSYYYLYVDLISYNKKSELNYEKTQNSIYATTINYDGKSGYVEIKLWENNQYLIEIMYNYAKIEVMVDESLIKQTLINSISILNSIKYNDIIIEKLLSDDNLIYTTEIFDMFKDTEDNSNILDYVETEDLNYEKEEVKDTDFIN